MHMPSIGLTLPPIDVRPLFVPERQALLALLADLSDEEWTRPTVCPGWSVKDVALHVLGVDLGNLSVQRDSFIDSSTAGPPDEEWASVVAFVADLNQSWVMAARRLSPRVLCALLAVTGEAIAAYFGSLDVLALGGPVEWAGPDPAPVWLHVAREYTERWVHQQQIRDALARPGLMEVEHLAPVLAAFVHALPHTLRQVSAPEHTCVRLIISGPAGGSWLARHTASAWELAPDEGNASAATVTMEQNLAWRLFTKGITPPAALPCVRLEGDHALGRVVLETVSIIA
jgi:uncharacterized protein (TIGR03083 family)